MRKHRFFLPIPLERDQNMTLDRDLSHQISRVLRLQKSDQIFLFNNSGNEYTGHIMDVERNVVNIRIVAVSDHDVESPCKIHLGQVIGKGEKMDLVIQKATELGITSITPLFSEHSVVKYVADRSDNKLEHWQRVAISASAQSWRTIVPTINPPQKLFDWMASTTSTHKLILHPDATAKRLRDLQITNEATVLIGPEGGFSSNEIEFAINKEFTPVSLGPRILRTETAGMVTVAILQAMYGDL